jgi:pimeloyl-ACP methyl ester carboxylesterase
MADTPMRGYPRNRLTERSGSPSPTIKRARSRGYGISYEDAGAGPAVVLLPGWTMSAGDWRDAGYVDRLATRYRVLNVDPLGNGRSDKPHAPSEYRQHDVAADIVAVLDAERVARAVLWGYSRGAGLAITLAADFPNRVAGLVLGGGGDFTADTVGGQESPPHHVALANGDFEPMWERFGFTAEDRAHDLDVNDPRALAAMNMAGAEFGLSALCHLVAAPALVYVGGDDEPDADRKTAEALGATYRLLPGLNHLQEFSEIDQVMPFVLEFLASTAG